MQSLTKFTLPKLAYGLAGLEPVISKDLLNLHYNKHHQTYITNLNAALEELNTALPKGDLNKIVKLQTSIAFNGGSNVNHSMYWENLAPVSGAGGKLPSSSSALHKQIMKDWGSFDSMIKVFNKKTADIKGSGWGWLVLDKTTKATQFMHTMNQDTVIAVDPDKVPLLTIDIWEHAFYLDYKNVKADYLKEIWKIINWETVQQRFSSHT